MCASLLKENVTLAWHAAWLTTRASGADRKEHQWIFQLISAGINQPVSLSITRLAPNPLSSVASVVKQEKVRLRVTFKTISWLTSRRLARRSGSRLKRDYRRVPPKTLRVAGKLRANHVLLRWATGDEFGVNCSESNFLIKMNITTIRADWDLLLLFLSLSPRLIFSTLQDNLKDSCCFILIGAVM